MALVDPFTRFTKATDFLLKSPVLRARVPEWLLKDGGYAAESQHPWRRQSLGEGKTLALQMWKRRARHLQVLRLGPLGVEGV